MRLAGARSSPDRVEIAYKMLGDDPDAGHMAAQPDSSPDPPETLSEAPLLIVSTPSTPILRETAAAQALDPKLLDNDSPSDGYA